MPELLICIAIVVVLLIFGISVYNKLVPLRNNVKNAFAQIETQLQRRFDLIPNLVETVKGYSSHEKELLENIAASRHKFINATSNAEKMAIDTQLTASLRSLFSYVENYPELKANINFMNLQNELSQTEEKLAFARQFYNDAVTMYNNKRQTFPNIIIAKICGFKEEELFFAEDGAEKAPRVQF